MLRELMKQLTKRKSLNKLLKNSRQQKLFRVYWNVCNRKYKKKSWKRKLKIKQKKMMMNINKSSFQKSKIESFKENENLRMLNKLTI